MDRFINSITESLNRQNWYAALTTALILPDICGRLEDPEKHSKARYVAWFREWLQPKYTSYIGPDREEHVFLHGEDCYALRCSLLHEGASCIEEQRARRALNDFHFITPPRGRMVHCNQSNHTLQLQVDIFSQDIAEAVALWYEEKKDNEEIISRIESLLIIHDSSGRIIF